MTGRDDDIYIQRIINGDTAAFAELVDKHKNMVFTIAVKILRQPQEAEEVAQDVFLKAYKALSTFHGNAKFSTWLYRIAYNTAISKSRRKRPEFTAIDEHMIDNYTTDNISRQVGGLDKEEQLELMNFVMQKLPEEENLLLTLFYKKNKSIEEISGITGYSSSNVKVKLYRIRKRMYEEMQQELNKMKVL